MAFDAVIVGAGAAGLAAAARLMDAGLRIQVLEARARAGGRAFTDPTSLGLPFDRGCEWLHSGDVNPWTAIAEGFAAAVLRTEVQRKSHLGDRWSTTEEDERFDRELTGSLERAAEAGRAGCDVAVAELYAISPERRNEAERFHSAVFGVEPERHSTRDLGRYRDSDVNWFLPDGFGTLMERFARRLPIAFSSEVHGIEWSRTGVRALTGAGIVEAPRAIVSLPLGVLQSGRVCFDPPLPEEKQRALAAIDPGACNKVGLAFTRDVFGVRDTIAVESAGRLGFHVRPGGRELCVGYVAGRQAIELERLGQAAAIDLAMAELRAIFGSTVDAALRSATATAWLFDPFTLGAYSALLPGGGDARMALAAPLEQVVFFAGEATSSDAFGTAHGAYLSGVRAADELLSLVPRRDPGTR